MQPSSRPFPIVGGAGRSEVLAEVVEAIPPGWQYPEVCGASVRVEDDEAPVLAPQDPFEPRLALARLVQAIELQAVVEQLGFRRVEILRTVVSERPAAEGVVGAVDDEPALIGSVWSEVLETVELELEMGGLRGDRSSGHGHGRRRPSR